MLLFSSRNTDFTDFFLFFPPCRGLWSRGGCVCSDFGDCTTRSVAPHYKSSWSLCAGDSVVTPPKTQWAHHILPYIQVTYTHLILYAVSTNTETNVCVISKASCFL